jgi:hypothetical protein
MYRLISKQGKLKSKTHRNYNGQMKKGNMMNNDMQSTTQKAKD